MKVTSGIVFSDDAVAHGAQLLQCLGVHCDDGELANNAFCKYAYRNAEKKYAKELAAQSMHLPKFSKISSYEALSSFMSENYQDIVVKPMQEGNNRGVIKLRKTATDEQVQQAFAELNAYLNHGVIVETCIPFDEEYSVDGLGSTYFITEKISSNDKYPVECGQLLPACISDSRKNKLLYTGKLANLLVGQYYGPFHNEIRIDKESKVAAVIEPNRRPAGMKIWLLAELVYGRNFFIDWIDSAIKQTYFTTDLLATGSAMSVMLPSIKQIRASWTDDDLQSMVQEFWETYFASNPDMLKLVLVQRVAVRDKLIYVPARDGSDFIAMLVVYAQIPPERLKPYFHIFQEQWKIYLSEKLSEIKDLVV